MKIKWELKGAKELRKMFDDKRALRLLKDAMNQSVSLVWRDSVRNAPHLTGHLRRGIHGKVEVKGSRIIGTIGTGKVHYTPYQEFGAKPKKGKYLVFATKSGYRKIREIKPKYFLTNALKDNINKIIGIFNRTISKIFK